MNALTVELILVDAPNVDSTSNYSPTFRVLGGVLKATLQWIRRTLSAGFSLVGDWRGMFSRNALPNIQRDVIHAKADEIDRKIRETAALRDTLRHVADCPAPSHMECPTFRRLVDLAGKRGGKRGKT